MQTLKNFILIAQMIPAILGLIKKVEAEIQLPKAGEAKLTFIRELIEATIEGANEIWPALKKVIDAGVKLFNATGIFTKKSEAQEA